jgi:hypothetical protein
MVSRGHREAMYPIARTRRNVLRTLVAAVTLPSALRAQSADRPLVGALRWDAWYAPGSEPTAAVERSLAPPQYQWRLPFFAHRAAGNQMLLPALTPSLLQLEIEQATYAGLDFWAFVAYPHESPMSVALNQYLAARPRPRIRFCLFTALEYWGIAGAPSPLIGEHVALMRHENYVRSPDGRPIYFLGFVTAAKATDRWHGLSGLRASIDAFRSRAIATGVGNPYVVLCGTPRDVVGWVDVLGPDAVGAYAISDGRGLGDYAALTRIVEAGWQTLAGAGVPVVPTVMSGWDRRPRIEHPVPWEHGQRPGAGLEYHFDSPRPEELTAHLRRAIAWVGGQPPERKAPVALIYAWNENDEGGWLVPTIPCNTERLEALHAALAADRPASSPGCKLAQ